MNQTYATNQMPNQVDTSQFQQNNSNWRPPDQNAYEYPIVINEPQNKKMSMPSISLRNSNQVNAVAIDVGHILDESIEHIGMDDDFDLQLTNVIYEDEEVEKLSDDYNNSKETKKITQPNNKSS